MLASSPAEAQGQGRKRSDGEGERWSRVVDGFACELTVTQWTERSVPVQGFKVVLMA